MRQGVSGVTNVQGREGEAGLGGGGIVHVNGLVHGKVNGTMAVAV